jgi:hypothetical protein
VPAQKGGNKSKDSDDSEKFEQFRFALADFNAALQRDYFRRLCEALPPAVKPNNEIEIASLVLALLTDLFDQGWSLESLFRWHAHFLKSKKKDQLYDFSQNLRFMLEMFSKPPLKYHVTLRIQGSDRLADLSSHEGFDFSPNIHLAPETDLERKFAISQTSVAFATTTVDAFDPLSAAYTAKESFEQLADLFCFDFEPRSVRVDKRCYVRRDRDDRKDMLLLEHRIPNPIENLEYEDFVSFAEDLDIISKQPQIEEPSKRLLNGAIRQYRFGKDSESYKDKFLNWWMGLEALAYVSRGKGIGETVMFNVGHAMTQGYLFRLLRDLATTLKYCKIAWPQELANCSGCDSLADLTVSQLLTIILSEPDRDRLWRLCPAHPSLLYRGKRLCDFLADPKKTSELIETHRKHLEWHLLRLYRIRCCIVHGSEVRIRLALPTANLEYYLKQTLLLVIKAFRNNHHIRSLNEIFKRASYGNGRIIESLNANGAGPEEMRQAVFANLVTQERPL